MASLVDYLGSQDDATRAATAGAVQTSHLQTQLGEDVLSETNRDAANGSYYSGGRSYRSGLLGEKENWAAGDIQMNVSNTFADLARMRVLASMGLTL